MGRKILPHESVPSKDLPHSENILTRVIHVNYHVKGEILVFPIRFELLNS